MREVERRVARLRAARTKAAPARDANTRAAEERLRAALGTRVEIRRQGKGGALRIRFASEAELNRLFEMLVRAGRGRGQAGEPPRVVSSKRPPAAAGGG